MANSIISFFAYAPFHKEIIIVSYNFEDKNVQKQKAIHMKDADDFWYESWNYTL